MEETLIAAVPVAALFLCGWAYLSFYLGAFAIDITEVAIPMPTILVFSLKPFAQWWSALLLFAGLCLFVFAFPCLSATKKLRLKAALLQCSLLAAIVLSTFGGIELAKIAAEADAKRVWEGKRARVETVILDDTSSGEVEKDYRACAIRKGLVQVFATDSQTFLLCRSTYNPQEYGSIFSILESGKIRARKWVGRKD
ncbi:hypothetical protein [Mariluticola halotolerans]|uniref:hypothetical protein n=1 Tax=Mariluticola halotolerans TaxID=2909283 RepID=UPI0026E20C6E|nr:hypothetical protein [Mariluticola halotolerans]UJQ93349.1 hypothetical protein L1P08_10100 [Mariluticola halotolerans]